MKESTKDSGRVYWIDVAKFFGIFAIVYGHTIQEGLSCKYVYSFHVPLFFFLQGVVFSITHAEGKGFTQYMRKKAYTLLIPYFCFAIMSTGLIYVASQMISVPNLDIFSSVTELGVNLLLGDCEANSPLWFLPCSFCLSMIAWFVISLAKKQNGSVSKLSVLLVSSLIGCVALYVTEEFTEIKFLPWKVDTAIHMLPFYIGGYVLQEYGLFYKFSQLSTGLKLVITTALLGIGALLGLLNDPANYLSNYYGNVPVTYIGGMSSCVGICLLSMQVPDFRALSMVGQSSLSILLMHKFPVLLFSIVIPATARPLKQGSVLTAITVTFMSIVLCCIAEWVIVRICPFIIGRYGRKTTVKTE